MNLYIFDIGNNLDTMKYDKIEAAVEMIRSKLEMFLKNEPIELIKLNPVILLKKLSKVNAYRFYNIEIYISLINLVENKFEIIEKIWDCKNR